MTAEQSFDAFNLQASQVMKKILISMALLLALVSCKKDASREVVLAQSSDGRPFHFMPIYENGVTDITIAISWPMQWAYKSDRNPATPYIAADAILSGGTDKLTPQEVMEIYSDKNSHGQLLIRPDDVFGELSFPKEHIDDVVSIASEMLKSPQFNDAWIKRIKQGFLANQEESRSMVAHQMWAAARTAVVGDSPLNNFLSLPDLTKIDDVNENDLRRWHAETIVQAGVTVSVTGAISRKDAGNAIDRLLSGLPTGQSETAASSQQVDFSPRVILVHLPDAEKSTLGFVGQMPPTKEGGDLTDLLALSFFARSGDGPLFNAVRTQLRASYGFQAGLTNYNRDTGILYIGGEVETSRLAEVSETVLKTYSDFRTSPDLSGFDNLRRAMSEGSAKNIKYVDIAARSILELALDNRDPGDAPRIGELLKMIQARDVEARMVDVFPSSESLIIVAASPDASALPGACVVTEFKDAARCLYSKQTTINSAVTTD